MNRIAEKLKAYQAPPDPRHIDVLDGVRALCVFLVAWFHIWQQSWLAPHWTARAGESALADLLLRLRLLAEGQTVSLDFLLRSGYLWVDGLILLSGFLLYLPYAEAGSRLPGVWPFYKRRLIRIYPSYLLCVIPLFILAWVRGQYASALDAGKDLAAHLTFTFNLFPSTYFGTPINGALWTLAVEMQFYLLFPLLARAYKKAPAVTYVLMAAAAFAFRLYAGRHEDTSPYFNQLPAFLDVYANGFLAASAFSALRKSFGGKAPDGKIKLLFTALAVLCLVFLVNLARDQAASGTYPLIRQGQMDRRFPLSAALGCFMVCACFSLAPARFLLGNGLMRFLASVSLQFYIYHQLLAVKLKEWGFPPSASPQPWMDDYRWQALYTLCCFLLAFVLATLITYLFERPIARALRKRLKAE